VHDFQPGILRQVSLHIRGALPRAGVERAIWVRRHELRACVFKGSTQPARITISLEVEGDGTVRDVELQTTALVTPVEQCMKDAARQWVLPEPSDGKPGRVVLSVRVERWGASGGSG
jgi:hypothetical protein